MPADLSACRLYGIVDLNYVEKRNAVTMAAHLLEGGVDLVQLRAKRQTQDETREIGLELHEHTRACEVPLIINDCPEVSRAIGAEGVHVGQDDVPICEARSRAGNNCLIGKSTHSIRQALAAAEEGADYIGFGPLFATPTKPDYQPIGLNDVAKVHEVVSIPIFCIGGIKLENLPRVIDAGARRVVIVSGLLKADDPAKYARACRKLLSF